MKGLINVLLDMRTWMAILVIPPAILFVWSLLSVASAQQPCEPYAYPSAPRVSEAGRYQIQEGYWIDTATGRFEVAEELRKRLAERSQ